jgi:hypothetical protein
MSAAIHHGVAPGNLAGLPLPGLAGKRAMVSMLSSALVSVCTPVDAQMWPMSRVASNTAVRTRVQDGLHAEHCMTR